MANYSQDPFYLVRQDIQDSVCGFRNNENSLQGVKSPCLQVNELQQRMSRFHGLQASNPERKSIAQEVDSACESLKWQVHVADDPIKRRALKLIVHTDPS